MITYSSSGEPVSWSGVEVAGIYEDRSYGLYQCLLSAVYYLLPLSEGGLSIAMLRVCKMQTLAVLHYVRVLLFVMREF